MRTAPLLLALALLGCKDRWRERVDPERAAAEPEQVRVEGASVISFEQKGYTVKLQPRARYRITGYAVDKSSTLLDRWDFAVPLDVALAWGPAARPAVLKNLDTHLSGRYLSYWYRGTDVHMTTLQRSLGNHHLIPSSPEIGRTLKRIRVGDLVTLSGQLVDVEIADRKGRIRHRSATSLSRDDIGSGACEQLWVEDVSTER